MKLIIQIPCHNEEATIEETLRDLPRQLEGFDAVEWLLIDDGCTDRTVERAKAVGVDHILSLDRRRGLARAFAAGIEHCLSLGADAIVNTDGDHQYRGEYVPALVAPILRGRADLVIGQRMDRDGHHRRLKAFLQCLGNRVVSLVCGRRVPDAVSGFRAISRDALLRLHVFNNYTYTIETLIQALRKDMALEFVPVLTNPPRRPSRLMRNMLSYIYRSIMVLGRTAVIYKPFRFFTRVGLLLMAGGLSILLVGNSCRGDGRSILCPWNIVAGLAVLAGIQMIILAFVADLLAINRLLLEDIQYRLRRQEPRSDATGTRPV